MLTTRSRQSTQKAILDYVHRYTIGIEAMISESINGNVVAGLRRLVSSQQLREYRHPRGFRYFTIGNRPQLSDSAFIRRYAMMRFCESTGSRRSLLTRAELERYFPSIFRHGMPSGYYIDTSEKLPRFGHLRADAVPARVDRIVSRAANLIDRYGRTAGVRQLIAQHEFEITFIVATSQKARRLRLDFDRLKRSGVTVQAHAMPELLELIAPIGTVDTPEVDSGRFPTTSTNSGTNHSHT